MMTVKPTFDRVLVKMDEVPEKKGKLYIPDAAREPHREGVIVAVGPGRPLQNGTLLPVCFVPGQRVYIGEYHGIDIDVDGVKHKILGEGEVLAVIERSSLVLPS